MAKTKSFKELVQSQIKTDKKFAEALLREGADAMLSGEVETGRPSCLTTSRQRLASRSLARPPTPLPKSLIRMFGPRGNPQARKLFCVIGY
jgi:hypothetical protein